MALLPQISDFQLEAGCDEAGRGCLAGPVVAAAVILPPDFHHPWLNDSKQVGKSHREALRKIIESEALFWGIGSCTPTEIDKINILNASILAMHRALDNLGTETHFIAVALFLLCSIIYCKPALEGKVLQQSDISQWKGMAQETLTAGAKYGQNPLWTNSMFGGMPTYQITGVPGFTFTIGLLDRILTLNLAEPINLFFLACICFYIL